MLKYTRLFNTSWQSSSIFHQGRKSYSEETKCTTIKLRFGWRMLQLNQSSPFAFVGILLLKRGRCFEESGPQVTIWALPNSIRFHGQLETSRAAESVRRGAGEKGRIFYYLQVKILVTYYARWSREARTISNVFFRKCVANGQGTGGQPTVDRKEWTRQKKGKKSRDQRFKMDERNIWV